MHTANKTEEGEECRSRRRGLGEGGEDIGHEDPAKAIEAKDEDHGSLPGHLGEETSLVEETELEKHDSEDDEVERKVPDQIGKPEGDGVDSGHDLHLKSNVVKCVISSVHGVSVLGSFTCLALESLSLMGKMRKVAMKRLKPMVSMMA